MSKLYAIHAYNIPHSGDIYLVSEFQNFNDVHDFIINYIFPEGVEDASCEVFELYEFTMASLERLNTEFVEDTEAFKRKYVMGLKR